MTTTIAKGGVRAIFPTSISERSEHGSETLESLPPYIYGAIGFCSDPDYAWIACFGADVGNLGVYGNYYGAIFELKVGGTPAALKLLWARENGPWKIIAYSIEMP